MPMASDPSGLRYLAWYDRLLRLYPQPFRKRFGEAMAQTFRDLYRERRDDERGVLMFALPVFYETFAGIARENITYMRQPGKTMLHVALGALALWMVPVVAAQFIEDW